MGLCVARKGGTAQCSRYLPSETLTLVYLVARPECVETQIRNRALLKYILFLAVK